eukprot:5430836-Lingulodinium_polyedra.AAC.1
MDVLSRTRALTHGSSVESDYERVAPGSERHALRAVTVDRLLLHGRYADSNSMEEDSEEERALPT